MPAETNEPVAAKAASPQPWANPQVRVAAVVILIILVALGLYFGGVFKSSKHHKKHAVSAIGPVVQTAAALKNQALSTGPFYWAGRIPGDSYEFTRDTSGSLFVRYVPQGSSPRVKCKCLIVVTYPFPGGYYALKKQAHTAGIPIIHGKSGSIILRDPKHRKSIYIGFKSNPQVQVVVYAPRPAIAASIATSGQVQPVTG